MARSQKAKEVGDRVQFMRKKRGLTQLELAMKTETVSATVISQLERGQRYTVPASLIQELADAMECSAEWLEYGNIKAKPRSKRDVGTRVPKDFTPDHIAYTDGGCHANPGGPGGYGAIVIDCATGEEREFSASYQSTTNNRMEMMAVIVALQNIPAGSKVAVYSDSQYVVKTMNGIFKKGKNSDLWSQIEAAATKKNIVWHWVPGHKGNEYNERCDRLATKALRNKKNRIEDEGYLNDPDYKLNPLTIEFTGIPNERYQKAKKTPLNPGCRELIDACIEATPLKYEHLMSLRTNGKDAWSEKSLGELREILGDAPWTALKKYIKSDYVATAQLRWYARGLPLHQCIRKGLITVAANERAKHVEAKDS